MGNYIYEGIIELKTPIGNINIIGKGAHVPFSVRKNDYDVIYHVGAPGALFGRELHTKNNLALDIDVRDLLLGIEYKIVFSGKALSFYSSDEGSIALCSYSDGCAVAIGGYDPNEGEAFRQDMEYSASVGKVIIGEFESAPEYDLSKFVRYSIDVSRDKSGFTFRLLDRTVERITFLVAWAEWKGIPEDIATDAVSFWVG